MILSLCPKRWLQPGQRGHSFSRPNRIPSTQGKKISIFFQLFTPETFTQLQYRYRLLTATRRARLGFAQSGALLGGGSSPASTSLHPSSARNSKATNAALTPLAKPLQLPRPGHSPTTSNASLHPGFSPHFAEETSLIYFFPLGCHLTGLYQIFADGGSKPNRASQLLHYLGPRGHPATHICARKVRDKQKVLLCSCLPAWVS